jgi:uncharacterized protein (TIGR00730 family)
MMHKQRLSIGVFCGARTGTNPIFAQGATDLGRAIAGMGARLVYGAGDVGLMGITARSAMAAGADCFGVIPVHLLAMEVGKRDLTQFIITEDMHERKKVMFMNSDIIAVLPGGAGSLDEFFEVLTWAQIGLHKKPIFLINIGGYWGPLLDLLHHIIAQGFADSTLLDLVRVVDDVAAFTAAAQ